MHETRQRVLAELVAILSLAMAIMLAPLVSAAEPTVVRVLFRDGPVNRAPVEIIDVRSGITIATAKTDRQGYATFEGLPFLQRVYTTQRSLGGSRAAWRDPQPRQTIAKTGGRLLDACSVAHVRLLEVC